LDEKAVYDAINIRRQLGVTPMSSMNHTAPRAQSRKKFANRPYARDLRIRQAYAGDRVRIASRHPDLAQSARQTLRAGIRLLPHLAVPHLKRGHIRREPV